MSPKRLAIKEPEGKEAECEIDVSVRLRLFGKPEKLREEVRKRLNLELDLKFPDHEIRRLVVKKK
jgi:hypothetical protein